MKIEEHDKNQSKNESVEYIKNNNELKDAEKRKYESIENYNEKISNNDNKSNTDKNKDNTNEKDNEKYSKNIFKNINEYTTNFSFDDNGITKISTDFIVPDHLVSLLIGKKGENVRTIMSQTGSSINFSKEYNDDCKILTPSGTGRICNLKGTPEQNSQAMLLISEMVIKYESKTLLMRKQNK